MAGSRAQGRAAQALPQVRGAGRHPDCAPRPNSRTDALARALELQTAGKYNQNRLHNSIADVSFLRGQVKAG
jgi:hypothetical protein